MPAYTRPATYDVDDRESPGCRDAHALVGRRVEDCSDGTYQCNNLCRARLAKPCLPPAYALRVYFPGNPGDLGEAEVRPYGCMYQYDREYDNSVLNNHIQIFEDVMLDDFDLLSQSTQVHSHALEIYVPKFIV